MAGGPVIAKAWPGAFFGSDLARYLIFHRVDTLVIAGIVTSGCVRATAMDAFSYNLRVIVPEERVADRGRTSHKVALFEIHMKYGDVLPLKDVLTQLDRAAGDRGEPSRATGPSHPAGVPRERGGRR